MSRIKSLEHLLSLVVHFITMKMRVQNAGVLMHDERLGYFVFKYQRGYGEKVLEYRIPLEHSLIQYFVHVKEALDLEQVKDHLGGQEIQKSRKLQIECDFQAIKEKMEELGAACCIPSFLGQELRNILVMGPKKSGDFFTEEDHNVLLTLAQESAIAIENARLYDEAVNKSKELQGINQQLESAKAS